MGSMSIWHWVIVVGITTLLFGRGRISGLMGDVAKGIKAFRKGVADDEASDAIRPHTALTTTLPTANPPTP
jgi:sec-independent protein translocase protein TatA